MGPRGGLLESALRPPATDGYTLTHAFHPYPGRFHRALPGTLLEALLPEPRLPKPPRLKTRPVRGRPSAPPASFAASIPLPEIRVLDPFMGGGTTLVEAQLRGLAVSGNDLNPIASLVARERTRPRTREQARRVDTEVRRLAARVEALRGEKKPPRFHMRHQHSLAAHYPRHLLAECMQWFRLISALPEEDVRESLRAVFSSAVVKFSNLPSDSQAARESGGRGGGRIGGGRTGGRTGGKAGEAPAPPSYPKGAVSRFLVEKCGELTRAQVELEARIPAGTPPVRLYTEDARLLPSLGWGEFDAILTSPPYPGTYDYHAHHRLRMEWLELDGEGLLEGEIGARREEDAPAAGAGGTWSAGFRDVLGTLARVTKPGGSLYLIMGDWISAGHGPGGHRSAGHGSAGHGPAGHGVDAAGMLTRLAQGKGWRLESSASVRKEVFTPRDKKAYAKNGKWEHLLHFLRGAS